MSHQLIRAEIVGEYYAVETRGQLKYMPRNVQMVRAIFGCFERTGRTLLYTAPIKRERDGSIGHGYDSEYLDDLNQLKRGNVDIAY